MKSHHTVVARLSAVLLLVIGAAATPIIAGSPCWDFVSSNQIIGPCTPGAECLGNCNPFIDITPGSTHLTVWSGATPLTIICCPGKVKVDQYGVCHCMNLNLNAPKATRVGNVKGDSACPN